MALNKLNVDTETALNTKKYLNKLSEKIEITIKWIKAHNDCLGNDIADDEAKKARTNPTHVQLDTARVN